MEIDRKYQSLLQGYNEHLLLLIKVIFVNNNEKDKLYPGTGT
ncbi:hypothetical protein Barb6_02868 [Bacteroidales bacterium Barb6]|nr:hypothetical protein Barb6_02868 [Bacteroidales bacterium Barb6]